MRRLGRPAGLRLGRPAGLAAAAAALITGCSAAHPPGPAATATASRPAAASPGVADVARKVLDALAGAASVRVSGRERQGGQVYRIDLRLTRAGDAAGTIATGRSAVTFVTVKGKDYLKVTRAFLASDQLPASICPLVCDKYLAVPRSQISSITKAYSWASLVGQGLTALLLYVTLQGRAVIDGQPAWHLHHPGGGDLYVAARGLAYPLRLVPPAAGGAGHLDFTAWNQVTVPPPPASKITHLAQLTG